MGRGKTITMNFQEGIDVIKRGLRKPLPGSLAQYLMAPAIRKTTEEFLLENINHRMSSVMFLLYPDANGIINTMFIERPFNNSVHSGQIALPGGKVDQDESIEEAALRETEEEIGVPTAAVEILGILSSLYVPASNFLIQPHIGITYTTPAFIPNPAEVRSLVPVRLENLINLIPASAPFQTSYGNLSAPYFQINHHRMWGATAMMVSELREMVKNEI